MNFPIIQLNGQHSLLEMWQSDLYSAIVLFKEKTQIQEVYLEICHGTATASIVLFTYKLCSALFSVSKGCTKSEAHWHQVIKL